MNRQCFGLTASFRRCRRTGDWRLFCEDHRYQPLAWMTFLVFTVIAGTASIYSAINGGPGPNEPAARERPESARAKPVTFDFGNPRLQLVRTLRFRKDENSTMLVGKCPDNPCVSLKLAGLYLDAEPPKANLMLEVAVDDGGLYGREKGRGVSSWIILRKSCHMKVRTSSHDVMIEVQDDRVETLSIWVAILDGSLDNGTWLLANVCPGDKNFNL